MRDARVTHYLPRRFPGGCFEVYRDTECMPFDNWITVQLESDVANALIRELINHSVDEVIRKLPKSKQTEYRSMV